MPADRICTVAFVRQHISPGGVSKVTSASYQHRADLAKIIDRVVCIPSLETSFLNFFSADCQQRFT